MANKKPELKVCLRCSWLYPEEKLCPMCGSKGEGVPAFTTFGASLEEHHESQAPYVLRSMIKYRVELEVKMEKVRKTHSSSFSAWSSGLLSKLRGNDE